MNKGLKELLKRAFDEGAMYEATLSSACSFKNFIEELESEQLNLLVVSQQRELLLDFMEHLSTYHNIDEVIDCTKHAHTIEQYEKSNNCG